MMTLWGRRSSANVQKVLWALGELGLPFERKVVGGSFGGTRDEAYLRMNPNALVPALQDGDVTMFESNAIVRYLAARYQPGLLQPADWPQRAAAEQWMDWQQNGIAAPVVSIFMSTVRSDLQPGSAAAVEAAQAAISRAFAIADAHLASHTWFAGSDFSFGDVVGAVFLWRYRGMGHSFADFTHLNRWFAAATARAAFKAHVELPVARTLEEWNQIERELA